MACRKVINTPTNYVKYSLMSTITNYFDWVKIKITHDGLIKKSQ